MKRNFQNENVTRENVTDEELQLLNCFRLGLLPNWTPLTRKDVNGDEVQETPQQIFNRELSESRSAATRLHMNLFGADANKWTTDDYEATQRMFEKFMEFTATWKKIKETIATKTSPNKVIDGGRVIEVKKVGRILTPQTENKEPKKAGRPKLTPEEKFVETHKTMGFSMDFVRQQLALWPNLSQKRIQEITSK